MNPLRDWEAPFRGGSSAITSFCLSPSTFWRRLRRLQSGNKIRSAMSATAAATDITIPARAAGELVDEPVSEDEGIEGALVDVAWAVGGS